jgi:hypothetical protein
VSRDYRQRTLLAAGALVLAALAAFLFFSPQRPTPPPVPVTASREKPPEPLPRPPVTDHPSLMIAGEFLTPEGDPGRDVEILETLLGDFARAFGENPVGENEEIVAALQGDNAKGLRFFPAEHRGLSAEGKLLDRWGTPWFFHALSGKRMEIISAGPDREMGTADDLHSAR